MPDNPVIGIISLVKFWEILQGLDAGGKLISAIFFKNIGIISVILAKT